jgi:hypothetical protein
MTVHDLSILALIVTIIQAFALIILHFMPTGYSPYHDAVSDYGIGAYRSWFWLQAAAGGLGCLFLGIALLRLQPFTPTSAAIALIVTAASRFLIPFFTTDQNGSRFQTVHGIIHMILAFLAFGGIIWAATSLWDTLQHYPAWQGEQTILSTLSWVMVVSVIALVLALKGPRLKRIFGIFERLFYVSSISWILVVAINLVRVSH